MKDPRTIFGRLGNSLFQYSYIFAQHKKGLIPDIYVQDFTQLKEHEEDLKKLWGDDIGYLPYVAIHLRVGSNPLNPTEPNYIDNPYYVSLAKTGYYIDAINLFPNRKFLVFSDDIEFAKTYFEGDKFAFDDSTNEIYSFNKMASCDSQIIANSSFSAWAAYLNPHVSKVVVAPNNEKWYSDGDKTRTVLPSNWIRI